MSTSDVSYRMMWIFDISCFHSVYVVERVLFLCGSVLSASVLLMVNIRIFWFDIINRWLNTCLHSPPPTFAARLCTLEPFFAHLCPPRPLASFHHSSNQSDRINILITQRIVNKYTYVWHSVGFTWMNFYVWNATVDIYTRMCVFVWRLSTPKQVSEG